jgi:Chaperone of endosialidase
MPRVDNPNAVANSSAGLTAKQARRIDNLVSKTRTAFNSLTVGAGGMIVSGVTQLVGGITGGLAVTGAITGSSSIAASTTITAGTAIASGTTISAGTDLAVAGIIRSPTTYTNSITSSFRNVFVTSVDGSFGFNLSSERFKQDIETAHVDPADVLKLRLVTYRYIAAVEQFGEEAALEHGFIAEEVEAAGLGWLVDYDEDGVTPLTLKFHLIAMALLVVAQDQEKRLAELERRAGL